MKQNGQNFQPGAEEQSRMLAAQQQAELQIWSAERKANLEIAKKQQIENISTVNSRLRAQEHADIAAEREFQKTFLCFEMNGKVILWKERFGDDIKGELPIRILSVRLYSHLDDIEASALLVVVKNESEKEVSMCWNLHDLSPRAIRRPFDKNGISFGFGEKKENEIRKMLLLDLIRNGKTFALPERHGWYKCRDTWNYAFPKDLTWKEIKALCGNI